MKHRYLGFKWTSIMLLAGLTILSQAQETRMLNDVVDERPLAYALIHARIVVSANRVVEDASLLIRAGRVVKIDPDNKVPETYKIIDVSGRTIYPGFVDIYSTYGMPKVPSRHDAGYNSRENIDSANTGAYNANEAIRAHVEASALIKVDADKAKVLRALGFGAVMSHSADGIARGSAALVTLGDDRINDAIVMAHAATHYSFNNGSSKQHFPRSPMGAVAVLRQTYLDAKWYQEAKPFVDRDLDGWLKHRALPKIFSVRDWQEALVAGKVGREFSDVYILKGGGDEYRRLNLVKALNSPLILSLDFPEALDLSAAYDVSHVDIEQLKHWELAPYNAARVAAANIDFAITAHNGEAKFWLNLRRAIKAGLSEADALAALTSVPAQLINASKDLGSLEPGKLANFIVTSGNLFSEDNIIYENWIRGRAYEVNPVPEMRSGSYLLSLAGRDYPVLVSEKLGKLKISLADEDKPAPLNVHAGSLLAAIEIEGHIYRLRAYPMGEHWQGISNREDGKSEIFVLRYQKDVVTGEVETKTEMIAEAPGAISYPLSAYGWQEKPRQENLIIRNATVWTNEAAGVLVSTDVRIGGGVIEAVGENLVAKGYAEIDAAGLHLTAGIVDEHSHIALTSINEVATNSSMVRMADVIDAEDIAIYRALAGGVTTSQLLHGSANPIGGQSALIKLRWGDSPEEMLIGNADKFIKFALGENVKRSRNKNSIRYPRSRMGVEQVYTDAFSQARSYERRMAVYNKMSRRLKSKTAQPRRDLVMEAMVEILNKQRFVTSHSYVQSEINMLMQVAESFDFNINTFTHILEGYKVADKMAAHGAGGSTFADWWAYKWEVRYAIPYNAALMHQAGVVTALNSDDAEMTRRLNQEAAKTVKYGGLSEEQALKLVTLNPAKLLHLDHRIGSIKVAKDADLVLWSDHPLSVYAKVEKTLIDGRIYFDRQTHDANTEANRFERNRLVHKMLKQGGKKSPKPGNKKAQSWHQVSVYNEGEHGL